MDSFCALVITLRAWTHFVRFFLLYSWNFVRLFSLCARGPISRSWTHFARMASICAFGLILCAFSDLARVDSFCALVLTLHAWAHFVCVVLFSARAFDFPSLSVPAYLWIIASQKFAYKKNEISWSNVFSLFDDKNYAN
jgi:hypothetical protein